MLARAPQLAGSAFRFTRGNPLPGETNPARAEREIISFCAKGYMRRRLARPLSGNHRLVESVQAAQADLDGALALLRRVFDGFDQMIPGRRVLDFGCGAGLQACAIAKLGAERVIGLETNPKTLGRARQLAGGLGLDGRVEFGETLNSVSEDGFDVVISQNSMEHFADPAGVLAEMRNALAPGGKLLITFGPPWLAPYGSHMRFLTPVPWVNILLPERVVMKLRSRRVRDGAARYEEVEGGLNRMTVHRFETLVNQSGLEVTYRRLDCVKRLNALAAIPLARELFINHVSYVLTASDPTDAYRSGREASWRTSPLL